MQRQVPLLLIILAFHTSTGLRCINNCEQNFNISQPFNGFDNRCGRPVEDAYQCYVKMQFFFHLDEVTMHFITGLSTNQDFIRIEPNRTQHFSYQIEYACDNFDDCARTFAEKKMIQMKEKAYNISSIFNDFDVLLSRTDTSKELTCYDGNWATNLCSTPDKLCYLEHHQISDTTDASSCPQEFNNPTVNVIVNDQGYGAGLFVRCSRHLCNTAETVNTVKQILFKHQITDKNGRTRSWTTSEGKIAIGVFFHIVPALLLICIINFM
ncbi:unnamed protein product [Adineta steineri]|uniref:Uncharacterized protein n=1 Tax=Adineta steineri TaxID=433720 RepID=A0A815C8L6_9BILA|nr:unnamed protein product [Adineta steineri]CAF3597010.1 unnamed protein product [Adineta steineri]